MQVSVKRLLLLPLPLLLSSWNRKSPRSWLDRSQDTQAHQWDVPHYKHRYLQRIPSVTVSHTSSKLTLLTPCSKYCNMDPSQPACVCQIHRPNDVTPDRGLLVVFTPVHVWPPRAPGTVEHVCGLDGVQLCDDGFPIFHANGRRVDGRALRLEK